MQFTTLFSVATSIALASAGVVQNRQNVANDVAVINVYDYLTSSCPTDNATVTIEVGPQALDECIPFSQGYHTVDLVGLRDGGYTAEFYITADCSASNLETVKDAPGACLTEPAGKPWMAYTIYSPA